MLNAFKRNQIYRKRAYFAADLLAVVCKLYNALDI
jgi:hypothetical protein